MDGDQSAMGKEKKTKRRAFLADLLFVSGGITAAAFVAKYNQVAEAPIEEGWELPPDVNKRLKPNPKNQPKPKPKPKPTKSPILRGDVAYPEHPPEPKPLPGRVIQPHPRVDGGMRLPLPKETP